MSDLKINNITNRGGDGGPVIAGVSTVATSAFMVIPSGDTAIRGAGSGRGIIAGGAESLSSPYTISDRMQYITISTTGNSIDFGDNSEANKTSQCASASSPTRMVTSGGNLATGTVNTMHFVEIATTGDSQDFGDLQTLGEVGNAVSSGHGGL